MGVCELLLFCFFTCFECNCSFGFPCPLCSFVNPGRVLSGRCLGVFLGRLSICFLFQINSKHIHMRRYSHQEFWGLPFRSLPPWFCRAPPRFVSGSEEQQNLSRLAPMVAAAARMLCVSCVSWRYILALVAVVDCHVGLTWKVLLVSAKKGKDEQHCQSYS